LENGDAYGFGYNNFYSLGINNTSTNISTPTKVLVDEPILDIYLNAGSGTYSYYHSTLFKTAEKLYGAGYNGYGQLGIGTTTNMATPAEVLGVDASKIAQVSTGGYNNQTFWTILMDNGDVYLFGNNDKQQCRLYDSFLTCSVPSILGV